MKQENRSMFTGIGKRLTSIFTIINMIMILVAGSLAAFLGPITHFVSVGGPDIVGPGGDKNFSIVAMETNGDVSGKYTDRFSDDIGGGGFQADVDCLSVDDNQAWVGGVITQGSRFDDIDGTEDLTGKYVITRVSDNGRSSKDPPDQISFSFILDAPFPCEDQPNVPLFDMPQGQVTVR